MSCTAVAASVLWANFKLRNVVDIFPKLGSSVLDAVPWGNEGARFTKP